MKDTPPTESEGFFEVGFANLAEFIDLSNLWMWLSIFQFIIILFLLASRRAAKTVSRTQQFKKEARSQEIDFENIINSSFNSEALYDELKIKCHPDRFPTDPILNAVAEKLFQEITKYKNNVKMLETLKVEAQQKLKINL